MPLDPNATLLANLINPQVMADLIDKKLVNLMRFAPLATIDATLQGRPGNTITVPSFNYIGDAATVAEGADISISQLTATPATATIHKIGNGVQITDEAVLSGLGDPIGEAVKQLSLSIASQVDNEFINVLAAITSPMVFTAATAGTLAFADIADALELFGEDIDENESAKAAEGFVILRGLYDIFNVSASTLQRFRFHLFYRNEIYLLFTRPLSFLEIFCGYWYLSVKDCIMK